MYHPICPVDVRVTDAAEGQRAVRDWLKNPQRLLVLASKSRCAELNLTPFFTALQGDGHAVQLYTDIAPNPTVEDVAALLKRLKEQPFEPTAILAIGGGSCMDLGKAVAALGNLPQPPTPASVREALNSKAYAAADKRPELIAMPTTAGTGSEVTRWATVWDPQEKRKLSIDTPEGYPAAAVIIPEWTVGMPPSITLSTGLDALSHAMEAFWAVSRNPLSQELAIAAVTKIRDALPAALADLGDRNARQEMALGSLMAGIAFSQTRTTACHSISYPLTMLHGIPHGFATAITLSSVMRRNAAAVPEINRLEEVFYDAEGFDAWMEDTADGIEPLTLSGFGVKEADLREICNLAFTPGHMDNNPVAFTQADVMEILHESL